MGKKPSKQKKATAGTPVVMTSEIDYDKLANAIVRAHYAIENEKREQENREAEEWRKAMGVKDFPQRPIRQFLNNVAIVIRMMFIKRSDATTGGATYSLIRMFSESFFGIVKWVLYLIAIVLLVLGIHNANQHIWISMVLFVLYSMLAFLFARLFRIAGFEVSNMHNREEIRSVSSTIAAIMALMVSIVGIVAGVLLK